MTLSNLQTMIVSAGILAGGVGFLIQTFRKSGREAITSSNTLEKFWQEQAEGYKLMIAKKEEDWNNKFQELTKEVGELRGQLNAETKAKEEYLAILKDKNPDTQKFMEHVMQSIKDQAESHALIVTALTDNAKVLADIHSMSLAEHERDFVVKSTITKQ